MQTISKLNSLFIASLSLFLFACNSSKKEGPKNDNITADTSTTIKPPPPPPSKVDMELATKRCFANDGLKYKTIVTIYTGGNYNEVSGNVTSEEMESSKKVTAEFEGTIAGDKLTIKFKGTPPVIGAASEWTDKTWRIENKNGKESLHITFNAKNYDTNKWEDTDYQFVLVDCKN